MPNFVISLYTNRPVYWYRGKIKGKRNIFRNKKRQPNGCLFVARFLVYDLITMDGIKAVIFDIDGTLTKEISWPFLVERLGISITQHDEVFQAFKKGEISLQDATNKVLSLWRSKGLATKAYVANVLSEIPLRDDAEETIQYLKSKSYILCLITGSMDLYAEQVAKKLGIPHYYSNTKLFWDKAGALIGMDYYTDDKGKKLEQFMEFAQKVGVQPEECVVVGDSANDIGLFEATGKGIAVRTEFEAKELEAVAWKKIEYLKEIKDIL